MLKIKDIKGVNYYFRQEGKSHDEKKYSGEEKCEIAMDYFVRIDDLDHTERKDEAIFKCKEMIRQARERGDYQYKLFFEGKLNAINGLYDDALKKIRKALELEPHNTLFLIDAGNCCGKMNLLHEAIVYYDQAINLDNNNLRALIHKANLLNKTGELRRALNVYDHALKLDPQNLKVILQKGITLVKMGRFDKSLECLEQVLTFDSLNHLALFYKGVALEEIGLHDEALNIYQKCLTLEPNDPLLLARLGGLYLRKGQYQESLTFFERVLLFEPNNHKILHQKGLALAKLGFHREAISFYDMSLKFDDTDKEVWKSKGQSLTEVGEHEAGLRCFEEALRIDENYIDSLVSKVTSLNMIGQYREAIQVIDRALEIDPGQWDLYIEKGLALQGLGMHQQSLEAFEIVLQKSPQHLKALFHKGLTLERLGNFWEAKRCFSDIIEKVPQDIVALHHLGFNLARLGRHKEAIEIYDEALLLSPNNFDILHLKGFSLNELGRHREALMYFNKAIELNATHSRSILGKGRALASLGKWDEALLCLEVYYQNDPGNFHILADLGRIMARTSRYPEAINLYEKCLEIQPKNIEVMILKAVAFEMIGEYDEAAKTIYRILKYMHRSDPRRAAFEFKYKYISRYKRKDSSRILTAEEARIEVYEGLLNDVLSEFWREELDSFQERQQRMDNLKTFIEGESELSEISEPYLYFWGDTALGSNLPITGGVILVSKDRRILINPGLDFVENFFKSPIRLQDINAVVITRNSPFIFFVIQTLFHMLLERERFYKEKAKQKYFIETQQKIHTILKDKETFVNEIQRLILSGYSTPGEIPVRKFDFILSSDVYRNLSILLSAYREFLGELYLLDFSGNYMSRRYSDCISLSTFPGRSDDEFHTENLINLVISYENTDIVFADSPPADIGLHWGKSFDRKTILVTRVGTLSRDEFSIQKEFLERLPSGRTGFLGVSVLAEIFRPSLIIFTGLEQRYLQKIERLTSIITSVLNCPCIGIHADLEISLKSSGLRCKGCGNFVSGQNLLDSFKYRSGSKILCGNCVEKTIH